MHVIFDETNSLKAKEELDVDAGTLEEKLKEMTIEDNPSQEKEDEEQEVEGEKPQPQNEQHTSSLLKEWRYDYNHPKELILGDPSHGVKTRASLRKSHDSFCICITLKT